MNVEQNIAFPVEHTDKPPEEVARIVAEKLDGRSAGHSEEDDLRALEGCKRVALADGRARAEIILYDELTTGLDPVSSEKIAQLIKDQHPPQDHPVS
jgi:ABC-type transporter Mla maintaining outer membrane lipid asymmetry ATPase subunit MlaF